MALWAAAAVGEPRRVPPRVIGRWTAARRGEGRDHPHRGVVPELTSQAIRGFSGGTPDASVLRNGRAWEEVGASAVFREGARRNKGVREPRDGKDGITADATLPWGQCSIQKQL